MKRVSKPRYGYLHWNGDVKLRSRDVVGVTYPFDSLRPGLQVSAVGVFNGQSLEVRDASIGLPAH